MITTKQRATLKGLAMKMDPIMQIGKDGLKPESVVQIDEMLLARELVKIRVLKNSDEDIKNLANSVAKKLGAECVQVIGGVFVLYRYSDKKGIKHIQI